MSSIPIIKTFIFIEQLKCSYSSGTGRVWLDDLRCTTSDTRLVSCSQLTIGTTTCSHSEDIAIFCTGMLYEEKIKKNSFNVLLLFRNNR